MKRQFISNTTYLKKKYIIYPPYRLWVWLGKKMKWFDIYQILNHLKKTLLEVDMFKELDIEE